MMDRSFLPGKSIRGTVLLIVLSFFAFSLPGQPFVNDADTATPNIEHGTVHRHTYYSDVAKRMSELFVYTPPGYEESKTSYPVLYLFHGRGEKAYSWLHAGFADRITDNLIALGKARRMIIVMPNGWVIPPETRKKDEADLLMINIEKELFCCIIPFIESSYRVLPDPANNAVAGTSLGGEQAAYIGLNHPEKFSNVAVFSAGLPGFMDKFRDFMKDPEETDSKYRMLLFCAGSKDNNGPGESAIEGQLKLHLLFNLKGISHLFYEMPGGGHGWDAWRYYLGEKLLPILFK